MQVRRDADGMQVESITDDEGPGQVEALSDEDGFGHGKAGDGAAAGFEGSVSCGVDKDGMGWNSEPDRQIAHSRDLVAARGVGGAAHQEALDFAVMKELGSHSNAVSQYGCWASVGAEARSEDDGDGTDWRLPSRENGLGIAAGENPLREGQGQQDDGEKGYRSAKPGKGAGHGAILPEGWGAGVAWLGGFYAGRGKHCSTGSEGSIDSARRR